MSEDFDAEDFDVPAVVTDDLENTLFGEVLQPEKEMNDDEISSDEELPPPTKQNNPSKPTKESYISLKEKKDGLYNTYHNCYPRTEKWIVERSRFHVTQSVAIFATSHLVGYIEC